MAKESADWKFAYRGAILAHKGKVPCQGNATHLGNLTVDEDVVTSLATALTLMLGPDLDAAKRGFTVPPKRIATAVKRRLTKFATGTSWVGKRGMDARAPLNKVLGKLRMLEDSHHWWVPHAEAAEGFVLGLSRWAKSRIAAGLGWTGETGHRPARKAEKREKRLKARYVQNCAPRSWSAPLRQLEAAIRNGKQLSEDDTGRYHELRRQHTLALEARLAAAQALTAVL